MKKLASTLAFFQAIGLLAADYTAEEVTALLDALEVTRLEYPAELADLRQLPGDVTTCKKCGKKMRLKVMPQMMFKIAELLSSQTSEKYEIDDSKLCPHCGDGRFYLNIRTVMQRHVFDSAKQLVRNPDGTPKLVSEEYVRTYPVSVEDMLILCDVFLNQNKPGRGLFRHNTPQNKDARQFRVCTEEQYQEMYDRFQQVKGLNAKQLESHKRSLKRIKKLAKNAEIFQRLTENATVLRREDLNAFLKEISDLRNQEPNFKLNSHRMVLSRMAIFPSVTNYVPLVCPHCKGKFHVANGISSPIQQYPLNDLLTLLQKMDIVPDYSSLCPYCHPHQNGLPYTLDVKVKLGDKEHSSTLSPTDLEMLLACLFSPKTTTENADKAPKHANAQRPFGHPKLTPNNVTRLRAILFGTEDDTQRSAVPEGDK